MSTVPRICSGTGAFRPLIFIFHDELGACADLPKIGIRSAAEHGSITASLTPSLRARWSAKICSFSQFDVCLEKVADKFSDTQHHIKRRHKSFQNFSRQM